MKKSSLFLLSGFLTGFLLLVSCNKDENTSVQASEYGASIATRWFDEFRALTKVCPGFTPPVASRAFGYAGVALYESVVPGMPTYQSLKGQLSEFDYLPEIERGQVYHWPSAANAAMAYMARKLYANAPNANITEIDVLENDIRAEQEAGVDAAVVDRSRAFGLAVAEAVFEWSKTDGGHEGYLKNFPASYTPPTGLGYWVPTPPAFQKALQPYWGNNRPFVRTSITHSQPPAPRAYSTVPTSIFYSQALEVYATVNSLTAEQLLIAKYWSDDPGVPGTPPGHSISVATQVLRREGADLALAAETYCKVGIAVADAFISCWKCKFDFNLMRPITYIQEQIDPSWLPVLTTPPFPEYTSGHSVQSGATAAVLNDLFGYYYPFRDSTHILRTDINGTPRNFSSFDDMANEAAISRLYGGIHYRDAIELGVEQGKIVGAEVNGLAFKK